MPYGSEYLFLSFLSFFRVELRLPGGSAGKENTCDAGNPGLIPGWGRCPGRPPTPVFLGFPGGSVDKESACNAGDLGLIPGSGRSPWRRKWQPTPAFLPGKSHGQRSLVGYSPWGHRESATTKPLRLSTFRP